MKNFTCILLLLLTTHLIYSQQAKFNHVLITNDDGIENIEILIALAKGVKPLANRVSVVVSTQDRSGSSNYITFGKHKSSYEITTDYFDPDQNIGIYTMPGFPSDCVLLGLSGLFPDDRPDFVLSGINGGSNIGPSWFASGTIGAIRTATVLGVPGIAFSGFDDDNEESFGTIPNWISKFLQSEVIKEIGPHSYLTVAFPEIPLENIKGVKVCERRISYGQPNAIHFEKVYGSSTEDSDSKTIWAFSPNGDPDTGVDKDDVYYLEQGFIVISAMTINENDKALSEKLRSMESSIPKFHD